VDMGLIKAYLNAARQIADETDVPYAPDMNSLMRLPDAVTITQAEQDEDELRAMTVKVLNEALDMLIEARTAEGERIVKDLVERCDALMNIRNEIAEREPLVVEEYKARLRAKLEEALKDTELDENRFMAEILYFSDRSSITEELVRLESHLSQLKTDLLGTAAKGRNLDFQKCICAPVFR